MQLIVVREFFGMLKALPRALLTIEKRLRISTALLSRMQSLSAGKISCLTKQKNHNDRELPLIINFVNSKVNIYDSTDILQNGAVGFFTQQTPRTSLIIERHPDKNNKTLKLFSSLNY